MGTIARYNFESFDIEYLHAALIEKGVKAMPIVNNGGVRFIDRLDPDGNRTGIVEELPITAAFCAHKQKYRLD